MKKSLPQLSQSLIAKRLLFLSVIVLTISLFVSNITVYAVETQNLSAYPTHASDTDPRSKSWFIYSLPAGVQKKDSVSVMNNSKDPLTLKVYAADATKTSNGDFALKNQNETKKGLGSWVTLPVSVVTLAPKEQRSIPFTIVVPRSIQKGEYAGGLIFEQTTPQKKTVNGLNINLISRVGVRIYETVPGDDQLNLIIKNFTYSVINNSLTFTFTMENKGSVHISPTGMLQIKDILGRVIVTKQLDTFLGTVLPSQPVTVTVPTQIIAPSLGWYTANVAIYYSPTKSAFASAVLMPHPWTLLPVLIITLLLITYLLLRKRLTTPSVYETPSHSIKLLVGAILVGVVILSIAFVYILQLII